MSHDSSKTSSSDVVFRPAAGASVTISNLEPRGIQHVTFENIAVTGVIFTVPQNGSGGGARPEDLTFLNVTSSLFYVRSGKDVLYRGGQIGPSHSSSAPTVGTYQGLVPSQNVVFDGVRFFDIDRLNNPTGHVECLFIQEAVGTVVRNSVFEQCEVFDLRVDEILGGTVSGTVIEGNTFGKTTPTGFYALDLDEGDVVVRNNVFYQGVSVGDTSVGKVTGCGNTKAGTGFSILPLLIEAC
jgi:hypothetical protein